MKCILSLLILLILSILYSQGAAAKVVEYDFEINKKQVNFTGQRVEAIAVNDSISGPTVIATEGDILKVFVTNNLEEETSIHWHGVLVPNDQDGVSYVTNLPIKPGETFTYEFPIKQHGTYWYHSHSGFQEQLGVYGAIVFHPKNEIIKYDKEYILILSDWTNENPHQVLANIKKDGDYYSLKKGTVQPWLEVIQNGKQAIKTRLSNLINMRMGAMDISDIGYDAFLINGELTHVIKEIKKGEKIRLRIINAGGSTYFKLIFAGGKMELVSADGMNVQPDLRDIIRIAPAETYDIIVSLPENNAYELKAFAEDGSGHTTAILGEGDLVPARTLPKPNLFLMDHSQHGMNMSHNSNTAMDSMSMSSMDNSMSGQNSTNLSNKMDHASIEHKINNDPHAAHKSMNNKTNNSQIPTNMVDHAAMGHMKLSIEHDNTTGRDPDNIPTSQKTMDHTQHNHSSMGEYSDLVSLSKTTLPHNNPTRIVILELTGNMERYVWGFNNKMLSEADTIKIRKGENVKFILINKTMMDHPLHLHGHFFRVLNGQGDYSPLKHTVNVGPFGTVEIEFYANEEKDWFFHCHNLYHMKTGMARIVHYEDSELDPKIVEARAHHPHFHDHSWFYRAELGAESNMASGKLDIMHNNDFFSTEFEHNYDKKYEIETSLNYNLNNFWDIYIGGSFEREEDEEIINQGFIGTRYVLPLLINLDLKYRSEERFLLGLSSDIQLTDRTKFAWEWDTDHDYKLGLEYEITKQFIVSTNYSSKYHWGAGVKVKF